MTIDETISLWQSKKRKMGCVAATNWFCKRVSEFKPIRIITYTLNGDCYEHVVATNSKIRIDLAPYSDKPKDIL